MNSIIEAIDRELAKLEEVRAILVTIPDVTSETSPKGQGRPSGLGKKAVAAPVKRKRRMMSVESKAKIAEAQKRRWAATRAA